MDGLGGHHPPEEDQEVPEVQLSGALLPDQSWKTRTDGGTSAQRMFEQTEERRRRSLSRSRNLFEITSDVSPLMISAFLLLLVVPLASRGQKVDCCLGQQVLQLAAQQVQQRLHHFGAQLVCVGPGNPPTHIHTHTREAPASTQEDLKRPNGGPHPVLMARICSRRVEATFRAVLS